MEEIKTKICTKCGEEKELNSLNFGSSSRTHKFFTVCKVCESLSKKKYYEENREKILQQKREYLQQNKEKINEKQRERYYLRKDSWKETSKHWREKNKEHLQNYNIEWREKNKEYSIWYKRQYYQVNRDIFLQKAKEYRLISKSRRADYQSRPEIKQRRNELMRQRRSNDGCFRLIDAFSTNFNDWVKRTNTKNVFRNLNYSRDELISYITSQFVEGMSWDNYGSYWDLDHKRPKSSFKLTTDSKLNLELIEKCWSLENLRPLWKDLNITKFNQWDGTETNESICLQYQNDPRPWLLEEKLDVSR
jgi:hypothetical protein